MGKRNMSPPPPSTIPTFKHLQLKLYKRTATTLGNKKGLHKSFHMRKKGQQALFKNQIPISQKLHLHKANMYGSFCTSCYKREKNSSRREDHTNSKHCLHIYKFATASVSVLYKNTIHILLLLKCVRYGSEETPEILYMYTDLII